MKKIQYLVLDVDGTLTDGKIYIGPNGEAMKAFSSKDGYGIKNIAIPAGLIPVVITGRKSEMVAIRCRELAIENVHQGIADKERLLVELLGEDGLSLCAIMGDDGNDFPAMMRVKDAGGIIGCPADASEEVREAADFVSRKNGGNGCVRDFIEYLISLE